MGGALGSRRERTDENSAADDIPLNELAATTCGEKTKVGVCKRIPLGVVSESEK
jgi:hypothetical protein